MYVHTFAEGTLKNFQSGRVKKISEAAVKAHIRQKRTVMKAPAHLGGGLFCKKGAEMILFCQRE